MRLVIRSRFASGLALLQIAASTLSTNKPLRLLVCTFSIVQDSPKAPAPPAYRLRFPLWVLQLDLLPIVVVESLPLRLQNQHFFTRISLLEVYEEDSFKRSTQFLYEGPASAHRK
ncbi:hypothetical protein FRC19_002035 [Serendipita sp. 401]|nr:hypothetical protein FRC19_002035 [Serendipita sp. 401]